MTTVAILVWFIINMNLVNFVVAEALGSAQAKAEIYL
jgi:hypothetical protein